MRTIPTLLTGLAAVAAPLVLAPTASAQTSAEPVVTHEKGYVIACTGQLGRAAVSTELYTNSTVTVPAAVTIETPSRVLRAADGTAAPKIDRGRVKAGAKLVDLESGEPAGKVTIRGTYRRTGPVTQVNDDFEDAGQRIQVTGTNQALRTRLTLSYRGHSTRLTCGDAFAYDLTTVKTPI